MIKFTWILLWVIQALLIAAKCFGIITISWWGVMMPVILLLGAIVLCFLLILLFAWATKDVTYPYVDDYE